MKRNQKRDFINNAIRRGYSVRKNKNGTYTFSTDRSKDESLQSFIIKCLK